MKNLLIFLILLIQGGLIGQGPAANHLQMLKEARDLKFNDCEEYEDFSFSNCLLSDKDTIIYKYNNIPPVHDSMSIINQLDEIYKHFGEVHLRKKFIKQEDHPDPDLIIKFDYLDGFNGILARADYPSCVDNTQYIIFDNYDLPPGPETPDSVLQFYGHIKDLRLVAIHEGGHFAGIKHNNRPTSIMKSQYDETLKDWDKLDRISFDLLFDPTRLTLLSKKRKEQKKKITKNFTHGEFFTKCKGIREHYIHNDLVLIAQKLRDYYNSPIKITSSYRNKPCNDKAGGTSKSKHMAGRALDLKFHDPDIQEKFTKDLQEEKGAYYLLIYNGVTGIGIYSTHTHIDVGRDTLAVWDYTDSIIEHGECLN